VSGFGCPEMNCEKKWNQGYYPKGYPGWKTNPDPSPADQHGLSLDSDILVESFGGK